MNGVLKRALAGNYPIQVIYESKDGTLSQRKVIVYKINQTHTLVWCCNKQKVRSLKIANILSAGSVSRYYASYH